MLFVIIRTYSLINFAFPNAPPTGDETLVIRGDDPKLESRSE
jgi:hypothetical protein